MDSLPDEILLMIFNLMPAPEVCIGVAQVCRRWSLVAQRSAINIRELRNFKHLNHSRAILITTCIPEPTIFFQSLIQHMSCLRELSVISAMPLSDEELQILVQLTNLNHLDVFTRSRIFGSTMVPIAQRLSSLVVNEAVPCGFLRSKLDNLRALHMYGRSLHYPPRELKLFLCANVNQLCELTLRCNELTDVMFERISKCHNLKSLKLYSCWLLTKVGVMHLLSLEKLLCLHITGARMVRKTALKRFLCNLPIFIKELVLSSSWFSDEHTSALCERLPNLHTLELWRCQVSAKALEELVMSLKTLVQFDTDIFFSDENKRTLLNHPSLLRCTCLFNLPPKDKPSDEKLKFVIANAMYKEGILRGDGEGFRADLFYYWTQGLQLEMLKVPLFYHQLC